MSKKAKARIGLNNSFAQHKGIKGESTSSTVRRAPASLEKKSISSANHSSSPKNESSQIMTSDKELQILAKVKWNSMQTDLKSALGSWNDLDQTKVTKSPEEEQFDKVKSLIEDLKLKLNDF
ncbi:MAG: hypothetical protein ACK41T_07985 [Pseudobdellovibrio sp.]